jgi:hypothetical protein
MTEKATRQNYEATMTVGEAHRAFGEAIAALGMRYADEDNQLAMHQLVFEGTPFGQWRAQLRRPGTSFYEKTFLEAQAVARAIVEIGAHRDAMDVRRALPPAPDVTVHYVDRCLYIEHGMVVDEAAMAAAIAVENANIAILDEAAKNPMLADVLNRGILLVRLRHVDVSVGVKAQDVADETITLAKSLDATVVGLEPDPALYPALAGHSAFVSYKVCGTPSATVIETDTLDRWIEFEPALRRMLEKKLALVSHYDPACRPVWLVLSASHGFDVMPNVREITVCALNALGTGGFDRVVVQIPRHVPVVVDKS